MLTQSSHQPSQRNDIKGNAKPTRVGALLAASRAALLRLLRSQSPIRWSGLLALGMISVGSAIHVGCSPKDNVSAKAKSQSVASSSVSPSNSTATTASTAIADEPRTKFVPAKDLPTDENGFVTFGVPLPERTDNLVTSEVVEREVVVSNSTRIATDSKQVDSNSVSGGLSIGDSEPVATEKTEPGDSGSIELRDSTSNEAKPADVTLGNAVGIESPTLASDASSTNSAESEPTKADTSGGDGPKFLTAGSRTEQKLPDEANVASEQEKNQKIAEGWAKPQVLLFLTGQQQGYLEPCGCTGLENQKGGLNRRDTLLTMIKEKGWDVVPLDVGSLERRQGVQAVTKLRTTIDAMKLMGYRAATLGAEDLRLNSGDLVQLTAPESAQVGDKLAFVSANAYILAEDFMLKSHVVQAGGRKIGVTAVLGDSLRSKLTNNLDVTTEKMIDSLKPVAAQLKKAGCDYMVLLAHASLQESSDLAKAVPEFDLVVTAGGYGEPTYKPEPIEGTKSVMVQVGTKGMYVGLFGIYNDKANPFRYQRVALSSQFDDSERMTKLFENYQKQLQRMGLGGLGISAVTHPSGRKFVGSQACADCHTKAFDKWKETPHSHATDSLIKPAQRSTIQRHFDPECLSCHVTGWNPQNYYPFASGYESLELSPHLTGSGCENCHGPGDQHVAAENGDIKADAEKLKIFREQMRLPLAEARDQCLQCHDLDNSPEFQHDGAFEKYWAKIAHPWRD